ncbi:MAG TPA: transcription antitermination factor NusB [Actinomycetota bacterium]
MATGRSRASTSGRRARVTARGVALRVVRRVCEDGAYSNIALGAELRRSALSERDRRLAADLTYGTIRRTLILDSEIERAAARPLSEIDPEAAALLRLGAFQVRFTRIPDHAAVAETVALAGPRRRGFVNAVLRTLSVAEPVRPQGHDDEAVSGRTGLAAWAVAELRRLLPANEVEPAAEALASPADLSLRANRCATTPDSLVRALRDAGHEAEPGRHHPDVVHVPAGPPDRLPGYEQGWFTVQDEASALVASAVQGRAGDRLLDACAGPGGKATYLACGTGRGGLAVAADRSLARSELVRAAARRLGVPLRVLVQDATRPALAFAEFDAALVDAPCSGVGAARRRPELLWRPARDRLSELARAQVAILGGAADLLRPGGLLVYSVCTFPRAETDAVLRAFRRARPDFEPQAVPGPGGPAPTHRLWPHRHGTDAMFYAGLRRSG